MQLGLPVKLIITHVHPGCLNQEVKHSQTLNYDLKSVIFTHFDALHTSSTLEKPFVKESRYQELTKEFTWIHRHDMQDLYTSF
jgi:hypothetical protein